MFYDQLDSLRGHCRKNWLKLCYCDKILSTSKTALCNFSLFQPLNSHLLLLCLAFSHSSTSHLSLFLSPHQQGSSAFPSSPLSFSFYHSPLSLERIWSHRHSARLSPLHPGDHSSLPSTLSLASNLLPPSIHPSTHLSIHLSTYLSIYPSILPSRQKPILAFSNFLANVRQGCSSRTTQKFTKMSEQQPLAC